MHWKYAVFQTAYYNSSSSLIKKYLNVILIQNLSDLWMYNKYQTIQKHANLHHL